MTSVRMFFLRRRIICCKHNCYPAFGGLHHKENRQGIENIIEIIHRIDPVTTLIETVPLVSYFQLSIVFLLRERAGMHGTLEQLSCEDTCHE